MEKNFRQNEIKDLDFNHLDSKQTEMIKQLLILIACRVVQSLEDISGDKNKITIGCMCGECEDITINQLIDKIKSLDYRGLEHIVSHIEIIFMIEAYRKEAYLNSRKYRSKQWLKKRFCIQGF